MLKAKTINTISNNRNRYFSSNLHTTNLTSLMHRYINIHIGISINKRSCLCIKYCGKLRMYINDFHNICVAFNTQCPNNLRAKANTRQNRFHLYQQTLNFYKTTKTNNTLKYQNYNNYKLKYGRIFQHSVFGIGSYFIDSNNKTFHFSL